jgi:lysophospholipase L1-like esterase
MVEEKGFFSVSSLVIFICSFILFSSLFTAFANEDDGVFVMGAMGDSITMATNSSGWGSRPDDSWATGHGKRSRVYSHFQRLKRIINGPMEAYNVAGNGNRSPDLKRQLRRLLPKKPDYVTFLIGGNDICSWPDRYSESLERFSSEVGYAINALVNANPQVKILMLPIPNVYQLWELGKRNNCQALWNLTGLCKPLLHGQRTDEERDNFVRRWEDANEVIEDVALKFPDHVRFNPELAQIRFSWKHVSPRDCFHPSLEGQRYISTKTWMDDWF